MGHVAQRGKGEEREKTVTDAGMTIVESSARSLMHKYNLRGQKERLNRRRKIQEQHGNDGERMTVSEQPVGFHKHNDSPGRRKERLRDRGRVQEESRNHDEHDMESSEQPIGSNTYSRRLRWRPPGRNSNGKLDEGMPVDGFRMSRVCRTYSIYYYFFCHRDANML